MNARDFYSLNPYVLGLLIFSWVALGFIFFLWHKARRTESRSESRFNELFKSNIIGYLIGNETGTILAANDYYLNLLEISRDELCTGISWKQFTPPEYMPISEKAMRELQTKGTTAPFEKEYQLRSGRRVWVLVGTVLTQGEAVSYILDISGRKRAERELAEAKSQLEENVNSRTKELLEANRELSRLIQEGEVATEKFKDTQNFLDSVIENIPNMIFVKDAKDLRFVRLNRAGEELIGQTRLQLLGKNDYDFFPKAQADAFTSKDREVLAGASVVDILEEPLTTSSGTRFLHTKKIPIFDKAGHALYLLGISEDITEKKAVEMQRLELVQVQAARAAAERTNARLSFLSKASAALNASLDIRSLLNSFGQVIVENMADWCVIDFYDEKDQTVDRIVALSSEGPLPKEIKEWWQSKTVDTSAAEGLGYVIRTGQPRIYKELTADKVNRMFPDTNLGDRVAAWGITATMMVPLGYHGKVFGALSFIVRDTPQKYDDFDLSIAQDLAKRASLAIENARLYTQASEASRAKSAFLANISHEIRTPLGAMLGFAELILDDKGLNAQQETYISTIARNGRQLLRLVDEILDLSKVESDRIQIERLSFSLPTLLKEVHSLLKLKIDERGLKLILKGVDQLPERVKTDPLRLRQILFNIVGNAIKFTERGSVSVRARFRPESKGSNKGSLEILVTDTGIGMSEMSMANIFQPFVQADGTMTRKYGGTGLGLFLSRKLARLLGGDVILRRSEPDRGSEFQILINIEVDSVKITPSPENMKLLSPPSVNDQSSPIKILLVDDSADNRTLISAFLSRPGIHLDTAENGVVGVDKALHNTYDLVLMDIQMPEMDGYEAIRVLNQKGYRGPVVALTAHAMKGDRERCLRAGFDDYLCKPVNRQSLMNLLPRYGTTPPASAPVLH